MGVMKGLSLLLLLLFVSSHSRAQDFNWNLTTKSGEEYSRVALERLSNDTLYFLHKSNYADWIVADSIVQLRRERRGAILPGTLIGAAGGGALGVALKPVARDQEEANVYSAAFGVVIGGVAGYLIGSTIQSDEVYELHQLDHQAKVDTLKRILQ
jgi:hypothetical protein